MIPPKSDFLYIKRQINDIQKTRIRYLLVLYIYVCAWMGEWMRACMNNESL
jgi:hypothetical protein